MAIPAIIAAAAIAAAAAGAGAAAKGAKEAEIQGTWEDIIKRYDATGEFNPEYAFGREYEISPTQYQTPEDIKFMLAEMDPAQREALLGEYARTKDMADANIRSQTDFDRAKTMMDASQEASSREQALLNDLGGKGMGGLEALIRLQGNQSLAQRNMMGGLQAASQAGSERLGAQQMYSQQLKNMYDTDLQQKYRNADTVNRFNEINAERKRQVNDRNVDLANKYAEINTNSRRMQDQVRRANARQKYDDKINRIRDIERVTGYKTGSIRKEGEAIAGGIEGAGNAIGSGISGAYGTPTNFGGGQASAGGGGTTMQAPPQTNNYYYGQEYDPNRPR